MFWNDPGIGKCEVEQVVDVKVSHLMTAVMSDAERAKITFFDGLGSLFSKCNNEMIIVQQTMQNGFEQRGM